jgi:hypothetical protein
MAILNKSLTTYALYGGALLAIYYGYRRYMYPTQYGTARYNNYNSTATRPSTINATGTSNTAGLSNPSSTKH